jgi:hypothetical protein
MDYEISDRFGYGAAPVEAADRDRMQSCARHLIAAITAVRAAPDSVALSNATNDFSAGIQPLLEAVFDCGDFGLPSLWAVEEHLVRYVDGKEDDLPDFTRLRAVLVALRDNTDGFETEEERAVRRASGVLTTDEYKWAQECAEVERYLNAKFAYEAGLDDWRD